MNCDISFVIVSWNAKKYLHDCIVSLLKASQQFSYEIIVVDNASNDGSWEMVHDAFPEVLLLRNDSNEGFAHSNNRGIKASRGRYLCLVNSDVEVFSDSIQLLLRYMDNHPAVGILGPRVLNTDHSLQPSCRTLPTLRSDLIRALKLDTLFPRSNLFGAHNMTNWDYSDTREVDVLSGCFWMIRREALRQTGLLDTRFFMYGEDIDFCRRFLGAGWQVVFYPKSQIIHHHSASSANDPTRFSIEMQRARIQYWLKYNGRPATLACYSFLLLHNLVRVIGFGARLLALPREKRVIRMKFDENRLGLMWLLSPTTVQSIIRGKYARDN